MYLLTENSRRRESVIAGLAAALVGVAMIAIAGKASAAHPPGTQGHAATEVASMATERQRTDKAGSTTAAVDAHATHAGHAMHQGQHGQAEARQGDDSGENPAEKAD